MESNRLCSQVAVFPRQRRPLRTTLLQKRKFPFTEDSPKTQPRNQGADLSENQERKLQLAISTGKERGDTAYISGVSTSQTARWAFLSISLLENMAATLTTCIRFKKDLCPVALEFHSTAEVWYPVSSHCKNTSLFGKDITLRYGATVPKHWHFRDVHWMQPLQNLRSGVKTHV